MKFATIPNDIRVPLAYVEFDSTRANGGLVDNSYTLLVLGQRLPTGTVEEGVPTQVPSGDAAETYFGRGSMLANMFAELKAANRLTKTVAIALDDDAAGVAATGTLTASGPATASGTLNLYIAGVKVPVGITTGDTADAIATAIAAAINANTALPVTAAVDAVTTSKVTVTARHKGEAGNGIDLRLNYYTGETTPAGVGVVIGAMTNGATNPDLAAAIAAMGDEWYQAIVMPYTDAANLALLETELTSRFGGVRQIDGMAYAAFRGDATTTDTFGATENSPHVSIMGTGLSPEPPYIWAAVNAAVAAASLSADPARPLQTLTLPGLKAPAPADRFTFDERNLHLHSGISTYKVSRDGSVAIERQITTYQTNAADVADTSYLDVTTLATLSYLRYATRARITTKFPRTKLAADGTKFAPGQPIVTPSIIRAELIALATELQAAGLVEDLEQFKADLVVEIDEADTNRVNVLSSPNLVNQLRIFAEQIQFIL